MEKEFIPYEWALKLKELGFDEPCFGFYEHTGSLNIKINRESLCNKVKGLFCDAPTWQQGFDFFREKYGLHYGIFDSNEYWVGKKIGGFPTGVSNSYEEARLECLKKLIELVKSSCQKPEKIN